MGDVAASPRQPPMDPVDGFFNGEHVLPTPALLADANLDIDRNIAAVLQEPLCFSDGEGGSKLNGTHQDNGTILALACKAAVPAPSMVVQLGAITRRVMQLGIHNSDDPRTPLSLFTDIQAPLIPDVPQRRPLVPMKTRATSVPVRQSARQEGNPSQVPVANRACAEDCVGARAAWPQGQDDSKSGSGADQEVQRTTRRR